MAMHESTWGSGLVEWQTAKRFRLGPFYVSLYYRYAVNQCGQKTPSPFSHSSSGTNEYRELQLGYFVIGVATPFKLFRKLKRFTSSGGSVDE